MIPGFWNTILRALRGEQSDPDVVEHVKTKASRDWRAKKLKEAAAKHGKPFKCGPDVLPRERIEKNGAIVEVTSNVTPINQHHRRKKQCPITS